MNDRDLIPGDSRPAPWRAVLLFICGLIAFGFGINGLFGILSAPAGANGGAILALGAILCWRAYLDATGRAPVQ